MYEALEPRWMAAIFPFAGELFYALAFLDLAMFGWALWRRHGAANLQGAILSTANKLVILGAFLSLLLNGSAWMGWVIQMFIQVGKVGSCVPGSSCVTAIQPSVVLASGFQIGFKLLGQSVISGITADPLTAICMVLAAFCIISSFLLITVEFVLTKVQTFLVLGMGIFFLGFGGSSWTRTYVERYFAYAISSGVRLMANYFLIGAGLTFSAQWLAMASKAPWSMDGIKTAWIIMVGSILYAIIAWRGSAIAAQILGGGPNLSHGDVFHAVGTAAQAGAAVALAASTAGAAGGALAASSASTASAGGSGTGAATSAGSRGAGSAPSTGGGTPSSRPPSSGVSAAQTYQSAAALAAALHSAGSSSHQVHPPTMSGFGGHD